ncbi:hypothetical protein GGTG_00178 [Gaeumannomyces tritici R3-111a-1]|uniref:Uncharacterized protein n=1 Tax=Gaeumannomyces tritici (strain R3-111a-1) TaxID=644352 RepID=J3NFY5_GAET3|nr:hypothetical protein GGTG_00178 [Gaeumannomyces tritici R3-111a-1]EJT80175.1 hypothetical protein GGTG_00178 [Gaeumannomyces tritici R3-111a-1]
MAHAEQLNQAEILLGYCLERDDVDEVLDYKKAYALANEALKSAQDSKRPDLEAPARLVVAHARRALKEWEGAREGYYRAAVMGCPEAEKLMAEMEVWKQLEEIEAKRQAVEARSRDGEEAVPPPPPPPSPYQYNPGLRRKKGMHDIRSPPSGS